MCYSATFSSYSRDSSSYGPQPAPGCLSARPVEIPPNCWCISNKWVQLAKLYDCSWNGGEGSHQQPGRQIRGGQSFQQGTMSRWEEVKVSAGREMWTEPYALRGKRFPRGAAGAAPSPMLAPYHHRLPVHNLPNCELQFFFPQHYDDSLEHGDVWKGAIWHQESKKQIQMTSEMYLLWVWNDSFKLSSECVTASGSAASKEIKCKKSRGSWAYVVLKIMSSGHLAFSHATLSCDVPSASQGKCSNNFQLSLHHICPQTPTYFQIQGL